MTREERSATPQPATREELENKAESPLPAEVKEEINNKEEASPADSEGIAEQKTVVLSSYPENIVEQETLRLLSYPEGTSDEATQVLLSKPSAPSRGPQSQPGIALEAPPLPPPSSFSRQNQRTPFPPVSQPGFSVDVPFVSPPSGPGARVEGRPRGPQSQPGIVLGEPPLAPFSAFSRQVEKTPFPPTSLPGFFAEETPLPVKDYASEIARKKTELLPNYRRLRTMPRRKLSLWLGGVSGVLVVIFLVVSVLAQQHGQQKLLAQATPSVISTNQSPGASTPVPSTPQVQPVTPFPKTLKAQVAALEAHDRFFYNGNIDLPEVALTFDDGPSPAYTPQVLAILKRYHVKATFFDIGRLVKAYPDLARQELKDGHIVGNHTWTHPDLPLLTTSQIKAEIKQTSDAIQQAIGVRPTFMRPPYGDISTRVLPVINSFGLTAVIWDNEAQDWALPGTSVIVTRVLNLAHNGTIILLHDGGGTRIQTVQALPIIIERLRARGYRFVTMNQIVADIHKNHAKGTPTPTPGSHGISTPAPESVWEEPEELSPWREEAGLALDYQVEAPRKS